MNVIEASLSCGTDISLTLPIEDRFAYWLALGRVPGLGSVGFKKLTACFPDPTRAFAASEAELQEIAGLDRDAARGLIHFSAWDEVLAEIKRARAVGVRIVSFDAPDYPSRLGMIADPPPFLYARGSLRGEDDKAVAIVGSRSASDYGRKVARDLAYNLAAMGFTVVSGMARGIDGAAHEAALDAGGRTIAVLGSGVDIVYPPEHEKLYRRIVENGAVLSELPLGTKPLAFNFPGRNRLISGVALGVVVVEATEKSGSLITAALALDQGREVFAVPGEVGASRSRGTHRLIRQGAKLVESVEDILEEIAPQLATRTARAAQRLRRELPADVGQDVRRIFGLIAERPLHIDEVIQTSGLPSSRVSEVLLQLELQGFLRQLPGKRYSAQS